MKNKTFIYYALFILAILLSACGPQTVEAAKTSQEIAQPPVRTLNVNGSAKVQLSPDIAYISIGVHTENENANKAMNSNNTQATKVIEAIKALGVDPKDIQTTNFSIYPSQQYGPSGEMLGLKYIVDNTVYVTLRDIAKIGDLLGAATEAGANTISGISFDVADKSAALSEARKNAVEDARKTAEELAQAAGVTLGPIQSINYSNYMPTPVYMDAKGGNAAMAAAPVPIQSGTLTISVDVNIVFEIK